MFSGSEVKKDVVECGDVDNEDNVDDDFGEDTDNDDKLEDVDNDWMIRLRDRWKNSTTLPIAQKL